MKNISMMVMRTRLRTMICWKDGFRCWALITLEKVNHLPGVRLNNPSKKQ